MATVAFLEEGIPDTCTMVKDVVFEWAREDRMNAGSHPPALGDVVVRERVARAPKRQRRGFARTEQVLVRPPCR